MLATSGMATASSRASVRRSAALKMMKMRTSPSPRRVRTHALGNFMPGGGSRRGNSSGDSVIDKLKDAAGVGGEAAEVAALLRTRTAPDGVTEYLVQWTDDAEDTWEPASNIAQDLIREFEGAWWDAAKGSAEDGTEDKLLLMLEEQERDPNRVDENQRTALHYCVGLGKSRGAQALINYGARVDCKDRDGYTPLHIAVGYMHQECIAILLQGGADPDLKDGGGRKPLELCKDLKDNVPQDPTSFSRRMSYVEVERMLNRYLWEESSVESLLDSREKGYTKEYLVQWSDGTPDQWVPADDIHAKLIEAFESGDDYAVFEEILGKRGGAAGEEADEIEYLVKWADGEETWEPPANLEQSDIDAFEAAAVATLSSEASASASVSSE